MRAGRDGSWRTQRSQGSQERFVLDVPINISGGNTEHGVGLAADGSGEQVFVLSSAVTYNSCSPELLEDNFIELKTEHFFS